MSGPGVTRIPAWPPVLVSAESEPAIAVLIMSLTGPASEISVSAMRIVMPTAAPSVAPIAARPWLQPRRSR